MFQKIAKLGHPGGELGGTQSWVVGGAQRGGRLDKLGGGGRKGFAGANRLKRDKKKGCLSGSHARSHNTPAEDVDCAAKRRLRTQG